MIAKKYTLEKAREICQKNDVCDDCPFLTFGRCAFWDHFPWKWKFHDEVMK